MKGRVIRVFLFLLVLGLAWSPAGAQGTAGSEELVTRNMGGLNSLGSDFAPIVSPDGQMLFFTSDRPGGYGGQDIWMSRLKDGQWTSPQNLGGAINDRYNQGVDCYVEDGGREYLYMTNCQAESGMGLCDMYVSEKGPDGKWGKPELLPAPVNSEYSDANATWDYQNNVMYFVSTRPGGMAGDAPRRKAGESSYDIWSTKRNADGTFTDPKNLGEPINTSGWEGVAFFHTADQTLYFSSDGHGGKGGADVFKSKLNGDGSFSTPEPVPYVNTDANDMYLSIPAMGDVAYLSSNTGGGSGSEDLYRVPLSALLPPEVLAVRSLKIPVARPVARLGASPLETVYFAFDRDEVVKAETEKLDRVIQFLGENPQAKLEVAGHACSAGDPDYNTLLSQRRAREVMKYLEAHGIDGGRMSIAFYGEEKPAKDNDPQKGNPLNRRVELSVK